MDLAGVEPDPVVVFRAWLDDVVAAALPEPMAMVLATAPGGRQAQPLARHVILRGVDERGLTWVTNTESRKGRHLAENPHACLVFPWYPIGRQVIVTGGVTDAGDEESDAYFATRPRESQIASWASEQSRPIPDRETLEQGVGRVRGPLRRGPTCRARPTGGCSASPRRRWSSGSSGRTACTTGSCTSGPRRTRSGRSHAWRRSPFDTEGLGQQVQVLEVGEVEHLEVHPIGTGGSRMRPAAPTPRRGARRGSSLRSSSGVRPIAFARRSNSFSSAPTQVTRAADHRIVAGSRPAASQAARTRSSWPAEVGDASGTAR